MQDDTLHRCFLSPDSQSDESGSEESIHDAKLDTEDNGYHDAENDIDPEMGDDPVCVLSGKLSESSGYAGSDLYDYKVLFSCLDRLLFLIFLVYISLLFSFGRFPYCLHGI